MTDYIKREDAENELYHHLTCCDHEQISLMLYAVPSADVVEVVRCKDCKHKPIEDDRDSWPIFPNEENNPCPCQCDDGFYSWFPKDDFYCGYGERAEA